MCGKGCGGVWCSVECVCSVCVRGKEYGVVCLCVVRSEGDMCVVCGGDGKGGVLCGIVCVW